MEGQPRGRRFAASTDWYPAAVAALAGLDGVDPVALARARDLLLPLAGLLLPAPEVGARGGGVEVRFRAARTGWRVGVRPDGRVESDQEFHTGLVAAWVLVLDPGRQLARHARWFARG
jgi:hypothetical protein